MCAVYLTILTSRFVVGDHYGGRLGKFPRHKESSIKVYEVGGRNERKDESKKQKEVV